MLKVDGTTTVPGPHFRARRVKLSTRAAPLPRRRPIRVGHLKDSLGVAMSPTMGRIRPKHRATYRTGKKAMATPVSGHGRGLQRHPEQIFAIQHGACTGRTGLGRKQVGLRCWHSAEKAEEMSLRTAMLFSTTAGSPVAI